MRRKKHTRTTSELFYARDCNKLQRALTAASDRRTQRRIQAVLLVARGRKQQQAAADVAASPRSVASWCTAYLHKRRILDLYPVEQPGRPLTAPKITPARIFQELKHNPMNVGYASTVWTDMIRNCVDILENLRTLTKRLPTLCERGSK